MRKSLPVREYYSSALRLREEKLPPVEVFYDSLHNRHFTTTNYELLEKFGIR